MSQAGFSILKSFQVEIAVPCIYPRCGLDLKSTSENNIYADARPVAGLVLNFPLHLLPTLPSGYPYVHPSNRGRLILLIIRPNPRLPTCLI